MAVLSWDWDDTVADGSDYPRAGKLNPKAVRGIRMSHYCGHENIFNSCRMGEAQAAAEQCAIENNLPFSHFNENCPVRVAHWGGHDTRKLGADVYIDDKNIGKWDWYDVYDYIKHAPIIPETQCRRSAYDYANHYGMLERCWCESL
jgi:hypothetical protein